MVLLILAVIITVIIVDYTGNRPDRRGGNPYALEVDQYREVDEQLITHEETRNFSLGVLIPSGMSYFENRLYVAGNSTMVVIALDGSPAEMFEIFPGASGIEVTPGRIFVGFGDYVATYEHSGSLISKWDELGENTVITNLAAKGDRLYVADAGNRRVVIFSEQGEQLGEFEGKAETEAGHGFIVPSASFDLAVNSYGELWVVNPGKHALENYSDDGRMRGYWQNSSFEIEGFLGCCNPSRITVMEDGSFVTSEKGLVRIKIYDQSGKLLSVVAPPSLFKEEGKAPDVCVDERGVVYALDFDKNNIRVFEPMTDG